MSYTVAAAPGGLPLVGHALHLIRDPLGFLTSLPSHGDLVEIQLGPARGHVACHPELVHQILVNDRVFDKGGPVLDKARDVFGNGLGTCKHQDHRRQRRYIQPAFHRDRLAAYVEVMSNQAEALGASWRDGQVIDVPAAMHQYTLSVTVRALFGDVMTAPDVMEVQQCFDDMQSGILRRIMLPSRVLNSVPTPANRRFNQAYDRLTEIADEFISARRGTSCGRESNDILSMLVNAQNCGQRMTNSEIRDQVITFFFGGIETTANTLSWAWHFIGLHPQLQDQLHAEAVAVLAGSPSGAHDLPKLDLTTRTITEVLRISPPSWIFTRRTSSRTDIAGHILPAGTTVIYSPYLLGHHPDLYDRPSIFDPARWRHGATELPRGTLVPFGGGARKCIGDAFAMAMAVVAMAIISARWRLEHLPGTKVTPARRPTLAPNALPMRTQRRSTTRAPSPFPS